jgi:hypothetical protein
MTRFTAAAAFFLALLSFDSSALTIQPLPGTTPQETCFSCVFPNEIGVIARDETGQPVAGVPVTFTTQTNTLGMVHYDDFCCVAFDDITVTTGPDGIARATAITIWHHSSSGVVTASAPGAGDAVFNLSSTAQRAVSIELVDGFDQYAQPGQFFAAPWRVRLVDANGAPVPRTMVTFYVGNFGGNLNSTASFNGGEWANAIADANGIATSPIARAEVIWETDGFAHVDFKAQLEDEILPFNGFWFHVVDYPITSHSASVVGTPPDSVQLQSIAAAPYPVRVLTASGAPAVGMPVHFKTYDELNDQQERCMSLFAEGSGEEIILTDANGIATPSVLYGDIAGACKLTIRVAGIGAPIVRPVWVFDPSRVVVKPRAEWVTSRTRHDYRVTLDFTENGRKVQPGVIEWIEVKRNLPGPPAGITGEPKYTFANNSATIELHANQWPGLYDLDIAYTATNHARVHVLQLP